MRKTLTLLALLCAMLLPTKAAVINGSCADSVNVNWSYNTDTKTLSFELTGSDKWFIPDYGPLNQPWKDYIDEIEYLDLPEGLSSIGCYAFSGAKSIKDVVLPQSLWALYQYSFYKCAGIHTFAIGPKLAIIAQHALNGCHSLTSLKVPDNVTDIRFQAFDRIPNVEYSAGRKDKPAAGARCVNGVVEDPLVYEDNSKTTIAACSAIATGYIRVLSGVKTINASAFYACLGVTAVELPNSAEKAGDRAFEGCDAMETLIIGSGLVETGMYAFSLKNLKNVVCMAVTPPDLGMNAFYDTKQDKAVLYVPDESVEAYKSASQWKNFGTIVPLSQIPAGIIIGEGVENTTVGEKATKRIANGQLVIEKNGVRYNAQGAVVR